MLISVFNSLKKSGYSFPETQKNSFHDSNEEVCQCYSDINKIKSELNRKVCYIVYLYLCLKSLKFLMELPKNLKTLTNCQTLHAFIMEYLNHYFYFKNSKIKMFLIQYLWNFFALKVGHLFLLIFIIVSIAFLQSEITLINHQIIVLLVYMTFFFLSHLIPNLLKRRNLAFLNDKHIIVI